MSNILIDILKYLISVGFISSAVVFLSKSVFNTLLNKNIEKFKAELIRDTEKYKLELNKDIEKYKSELQILLKESEVKFTKLHLERSEIIRQTYMKLTNAELALRVLINYFENQIEHKEYLSMCLNESNNQINDFSFFTEVNRIYFNDDICSLINEICKIMYKINIQNNSSLDYIKTLVNKEYITTASKLIEESIPILKIKLVAEFRKILGVQ